MKPEIADILQTVVALVPGTPAVVNTILEIARRVDTPEEFYGELNKLIAISPVQGVKA